jgi:hypothetical protein
MGDYKYTTFVNFQWTSLGIAEQLTRPKLANLRMLTVHSPWGQSRQTMPDLYISQILSQFYHNVIVWERICDGGKFFCKP